MAFRAHQGALEHAYSGRCVSLAENLPRRQNFACGQTSGAGGRGQVASWGCSQVAPRGCSQVARGWGLCFVCGQITRGLRATSYPRGTQFLLHSLHSGAHSCLPLLPLESVARFLY
jgi:hypothetical protein